MNMDLGAISARQSAPTDGRDEFTNSAGKGFYTSKQNSDAKGLFYQWGRKDPFTFATSSELWGDNSWNSGMYPVKIYTIDGVLIYQKENGGDNKDKQPVGGVIVLTTNATSMMETIKNLITFHGGSSCVISQDGYTKDLWDYYWTSYSRGMDGSNKWHNDYLDEYIYQRSKSIYDPCPYGFRIPSNGTHNEFKTNLGWIWGSYIGGAIWNIDNLGSTWFAGLGRRSVLSIFEETARYGIHFVSTIYNQNQVYAFEFNADKRYLKNYNDPCSRGQSVRCIEDCERRLSSQHLPCGTTK